LQSPKLNPTPIDFRIDEKFLQEAFVIAAEANGAMANHSNGKLVDDAFRIGPAIDVVAEIDLNGSLNWTPSDVRVDPIDEVGKEIGTTVDIADGIHPNAGR
jgi:hypothetical protein